MCLEEMEQVPGVIHHPGVEEWGETVPEQGRQETVYAPLVKRKFPIKGEFPVTI